MTNDLAMIAYRLNERCEELQRENEELRADIGELEAAHRLMHARNERLERERATLRTASQKLHETINTYWQGDCDKIAVIKAQSALCRALATTEPSGKDENK